MNAPRVTKEEIEANIAHREIVKHVTHSGQVLRWGVITMKNGFSVTGRPSAAVSPENDDPALGEKIAMENAFEDIWPLMGFALKDRLHRGEPPVPVFSGRRHAAHREKVLGALNACVCGCPPEKMDLSSAHADYCPEK